MSTGQMLDDSDMAFGERRLTQESANFSEARFLGSWQFVNVTAGVGSYQGDLRETTISGTEQSPEVAIDVRSRTETRYADVKLPKGLLVSGGLSRETFTDGQLNREPWNPKLGFSLSLGPRTTMRGALFRTLKRTVISSQTIEPTQVAGFNQFFDGANGTDAWRHAIAIDSEMDDTNCNVGVEASVRNLVIPAFLSATRAVLEFHNDEQLARIYLHTARDLAGAEHGVSSRTLSSRRGRLLFWSGGERPSTHKLRAEGRVFGTTGKTRGLFGRLRVTFVDQHGRFYDSIAATVVPGADSFATVDVSLGRHRWGQRGIFAIEGQNIFDAASGSRIAHQSNRRSCRRVE